MIDKLKRITRDGRWIPEIDGLRFIAIGSVFLFHLNQMLETHSGGGAPSIQHRYAWLATGLDNGFRGVRLFFVISGFILGLPFARHSLAHGQPVKIGKYFLRRLTRLEPPYILSYAIVILLWAVYTHGHGITKAYFEHVAAGLVYMHTLAFPRAESVNPVTWSLEIEIQFYILAPLLAYFFRIRNATVRRGVMLALIALAGFLQAYVRDEFLKHTILFYIQYFLAGFLFADLYLSYPDRKSNWRWDVFGLLGWTLFFLIPGSRWTNGFYPFLLVPLCATAFYSRYLRLFFANSVIAVIGGMCYSIYLLHSVLISAVFKITRHLVITGDYLISLILQIVVTGVPVFLMCAIYFVYVERYFMRPDWPQQWAARWRKEPTAEAAVK